MVTSEFDRTYICRVADSSRPKRSPGFTCTCTLNLIKYDMCKKDCIYRGIPIQITALRKTKELYIKLTDKDRQVKEKIANSLGILASYQLLDIGNKQLEDHMIVY